MEENKLTADDFFKSLKTTLWRIKNDNQWYELRVAETLKDPLFVDKDGELFGVKNAKINFYVFKSGTNETSDWSQNCLKKAYLWYRWYELPPDETEVNWDVTYPEGFILYLLNYEKVLVFTPEGHKVKDWCSDPNAVY